MIDHVYTAARDRGNRGGGISIGLIDADPAYHATRMRARIGRIVPDATIHLGSAQTGASEIYRLGSAGCPILCLPFVLGTVSNPALLPSWSAAIEWATGNGVLVFAGVGNGSDVTLMPAAHPNSLACAAIYSDGRLDPAGSSKTGRIDIVTLCDEKSSGSTADAAGMAAQWLAAGGVYLFGNSPHRLPGFKYWLWLTGTATARGIAPYCGNL